jgi:hypothetical protein
MRQNVEIIYNHVSDVKKMMCKYDTFSNAHMFSSYFQIL